ncbi:MAG: lamin tail domain-containing protein, partial [Bacteroidota bacterium]|nr:lamin tail domain-containing protein [Bacteroidota bacterium]
MKTNKIHIIAMLILAVLFSNCTKDKIFEKENTSNSEITLKINEIYSNSDTEPDWFEVYNPGDVDVDMSGFSAYDKVDAKFTWPTGTIIPAKGHLVLICDKDLATSDATKYANFKLSSGGESLTLLDDEGNIVDELDFPALDLETTYSRLPDGSDTWGIANPTQGTANS